MKTYALVGHFNKAIEDNILELWKELKDNGVSDYGFTYDGRLPHLTITDIETDELDEMIHILNEVIVNQIDIKFQSISNFLGTATLMYNIFPSADLINLHDYLSDKLKEYIPQNSLYRKNNWVPHVTIASRLCDKGMLDVYSMAKLSDIVTGKLEKLVLLEINSNSDVKIVYEIEINELREDYNLSGVYDDDCIFCKIANHQMESKIIYEDELVIAFLDIDPISEGHVLIIPKKHILDLDELSEEESNRVMKVSKHILRGLRKVYSFEGYSIMQNGGIFNDVGHYHMHIFPRYKNDGFSWNFKEGFIETSDNDFDKLKKEIKELIIS